MEKLQSGIQTGEKQLISGAGRSEDGSDGSAVRGEYGPADVAVGGHGRQLPPKEQQTNTRVTLDQITVSISHTERSHVKGICTIKLTQTCWFPAGGRMCAGCSGRGFR